MHSIDKDGVVVKIKNKYIYYSYTNDIVELKESCFVSVDNYYDNIHEIIKTYIIKNIAKLIKEYLI